MKSLSTWLLVMFMGMFLIFRVAVCLFAQDGNDFGGFIAFNFNIEVALLFITILCIILFSKRKIIGGIIYILTYGYYFGSYLVTNISVLIENSADMNMAIIQNVMVSAIAIILAVFVLGDLLLARARKREPKDKKTDWFFKNEQYDRKLDERADKNQYRNY